MNSEFLTQIFTVIHQIPVGKVLSYGAVAKMAGYPGYARHVGKALSQLPSDSSLPWYRVVNSQGKISLKDEDFERQKQYLQQEGIDVTLNGRINMNKYVWQP